MNDPLLMRVLDCVADRHEQFESFLGSELVAVAILGDGNAADQLHDEVRPACVGGAGVEHFGDVLVVHERQSLPLGLEAGDHLGGIHARLDDLEGDPPAYGLFLLGHVDDAHAPFTDFLQQPVQADVRSGAFGDRMRSGWLVAAYGGRLGRVSVRRAGGIALGPVPHDAAAPRPCGTTAGTSWPQVGHRTLSAIKGALIRGS